MIQRRNNHAALYSNMLSHQIISKLRASWLHRRGMLRAKLGHHVLALEDYTAVIEMPVAPASIRAMALYNRALVYHATGDQTQSIKDLNKLAEMPGASGQVRTEAKRKLVRMQRSSRREETR